MKLSMKNTNNGDMGALLIVATNIGIGMRGKFWKVVGEGAALVDNVFMHSGVGLF